jgi:hypothetical protein
VSDDSVVAQVAALEGFAYASWITEPCDAVEKKSIDSFGDLRIELLQDDAARGSNLIDQRVEAFFNVQGRRNASIDPPWQAHYKCSANAHYREPLDF